MVGISKRFVLSFKEGWVKDMLAVGGNEYSQAGSFVKFLAILGLAHFKALREELKLTQEQMRLTSLENARLESKLQSSQQKAFSFDRRKENDETKE